LVTVYFAQKMLLCLRDFID